MGFLEELAKGLGQGFQEQYNVRTYGPQYAQQWAEAPQAEIARLLQVAEAGQRLQGVLAGRQTEEALAAKAFPGMEPEMALRLYRMSEAERKRQQEITQEATEAELRSAQARSAISLAQDRPAEEARRRAEHESLMAFRERQLGLQAQETGASLGLKSVQTAREKEELDRIRRGEPATPPTERPAAERLPLKPLDPEEMVQLAKDDLVRQAADRIRKQNPDLSDKEVTRQAEAAVTPEQVEALGNQYVQAALARREKALNVVRSRRGAGPETAPGTGRQPGDGPPCPSGVNEGAQIRSRSTGRVAVCRGGRLVVQQQ